MKLIVNCSQPMPSLQSSGHVPEPKSWLMHRVLKIKPYVVSIFKKCRTKKPTVASHIWKERTVKNTSKVISALGGTSLLWQLSAKYKAQKSWVLGRRHFFFWSVEFTKKEKNHYRVAEVPWTLVTHQMRALLLFLFWNTFHPFGVKLIH